MDKSIKKNGLNRISTDCMMEQKIKVIYCIDGYKQIYTLYNEYSAL